MGVDCSIYIKEQQLFDTVNSDLFAHQALDFRVQPQPSALKGDAEGRRPVAREPAAVKGKSAAREPAAVKGRAASVQRGDKTRQPGAGKGSIGGKPVAGGKESGNGGRAATPGGRSWLE